MLAQVSLLSLKNSSQRVLLTADSEREVLASAWAELNALVPGLPQGVSEFRALGGLGGGTTLALAYVQAALKSGGMVAWVDPSAELYAPALVQAGIDLDRLLVVRPLAEDARKVAVKLAASEAFELVVFDLRGPQNVRARVLKDEVFIRKLSVTHTRAIVLTDANAFRSAPWPTALTIDVQRHQGGITARIVKERHGLIGKERTLRTVPWLEAA
jgi:hypothetical protein